jgi:lysophospholipase L1-like esterase
MIISRTENLLRQVAGRNQGKPIFVISPFYNCGDDFNKEKRAGGERWRRLVGEIVAKLNYPNVTYINGLDVIGDMSYMSADEIHPNIYGVQKIADVLTEKIKFTIKESAL